MENDVLYDIFKVAIYNEYEAHEFYKKAAAETRNEEVKRLFEKFAASELRHRNELEELYRRLKNEE